MDDLEQLREKLKSKLEVAKFFTGFISVVFGFLLKDNLLSSASELIRPYAYAAIFFFITSLVFSIGAVFAYDRLLMPEVFWQPQLQIGELFRHMIAAWQFLFMPAVAALSLGLLASCVVATSTLWPTLALWVVPVIVVISAYAFLGRHIHFQD
jgi:hypothetical protein